MDNSKLVEPPIEKDVFRAYKMVQSNGKIKWINLNANAINSSMYAILYLGPDISFAVRVSNWIPNNMKLTRSTAVKRIIRKFRGIWALCYGIMFGSKFNRFHNAD